jgi:hypothetical protein
MEQKTRAQRGLRRISQSVFRQVDVHRDTPAQALRQDFLAIRFGLMPIAADMLAELVFSVAGLWGRA